ncbi:MAG: permease [Planctomycetota bacterium]
MSERAKLALVLGVFALARFVPFDDPRVQGAILESLSMLGEYAREHVLTCLVPAFFIAGAIATFLDQGVLLRFLGPTAPKVVSYSVASLAGTALAVCSCTVLPLFAGIRRRGAGLGPACTFLYSGPAINVLAIVLTGRVLGVGLGIARAVGAILVSISIGVLMSALFGRESTQDSATTPNPFARSEADSRALRRAMILLGALVALLVFAAWGRPGADGGFAATVFERKWWLAGGALVLVILLTLCWFDGDARRQWLEESWSFVKLITPLLLLGVLITGLLLGRPGSDSGPIPIGWIASSVGGNSIAANLLAAFSGALMYFATLTEVPILQGLLGHGMGPGPALAMLLAGPALSLPSLLVVRGVLGTSRTLAYAGFVVLFSTLAGLGYGSLV